MKSHTPQKKHNNSKPLCRKNQKGSSAIAGSCFAFFTVANATKTDVPFRLLSGGARAAGCRTANKPVPFLSSPATPAPLARCRWPFTVPATNAISHGRRSFLVVMAASRRSRQVPSPLRGGHGGGRCPFVVVTAEVVFTPTQKQRKKTLHVRLPPFLSQEPAWGLRLFAALAPPGEIFGGIAERKKKSKPKKASSTGRGPWAVVMWRSSPRRLGGHGGLLRTRPVVLGGGLSWFLNLAVKAP